MSEWYRIPPVEAAKRSQRFNGRAEPVRTAEVLTQPDSVPSTAISSSADTGPHYSSITTRVDVHPTDMDADENSIVDFNDTTITYNHGVTAAAASED